jgi:hypothetical protein
MFSARIAVEARWFSQESLMDFNLYVAMAQITLETAKSRSIGWILWPENRFLRKPWLKRH